MQTTKQGSTKSSWVEDATAGPVVRRALAYGVIVGAILISINHGDAILRGDVDEVRIVKMVVTVFVPYLVSTLSSIQALRGGRPRA